jgi:cytochrome c biogenesis protein
MPKGFGYRRIEETDKGFCIFAEKGRWTRLGVYTVHMSVVLLLLGGLIGSLFGFEGFVNIPEGEAVNHIRLRNTGKLHQLDFEIRCDDFNVTFYDSHGRMPKEYRSSLTILEQDQPVFKKNIIVNDPLRYKGINIFQSSYGKLPPKERPLVKNPPEEIILNFTSMETGMRYRLKTVMDKSFDIPEGAGTFMIKSYMDSAAFRGQPIGEAFIGILTPKDGNPVEVLLPLRYPNFDRMRKGDYAISVVISKDDQMISVEDQNLRYYTGLQVTKDPGVWIVYSGFVVMIIGCFITFFMSHQRLCIEVIKNGEKSKVMVAGTSNKNKLGMQSRVKSLSRRLLRLNRKP